MLLRDINKGKKSTKNEGGQRKWKQGEQVEIKGKRVAEEATLLHP